MRWLVVPAALALGCPPPAQYREVRPGLSCERATRVAYRTIESLGYTVTEVVVASPERAGVVSGTKTDAEGQTRVGRARITCDARGAVVQPIEDALVPNYDFSRGFGYSFKELVQRPDVTEPSVARGLQILLHAVSPQRAVLDLGGVPTVAGAVPVRVTVRNDTDRAVLFDPARLELVPEAGAAAAPLGGPALEAALAPGAAGERVRGELLGRRPVAPHTTASGFLVFPSGRYREARITIEDVETGEGEGFIAPVQ